MSNLGRRLRQVDHISAPDLWSGIETREPRPPAQNPRSRVLTVALALALAATGMFFAVRAFVFSSDQATTPAGLAGSDLLPIPPRGETTPEFLADGRPVFVVHHEDGRVSVVDAFSTHRPWGVEELVGWCASGRYFHEREHGATFNENGWYLDGPASADLAYFETERTPGEMIRVGLHVEPQTRSGYSATQPGFQGPPCYHDGNLPGPPPPQMHRFPESPTFASPKEAIESQPEGWVKLHGTLLVRWDEPTYLCAWVEGDSCSSAAEVEGIDAQGWGRPMEITEGGELIERAESRGWSRLVEEGQWIARVEGDALVELTRLDTRVEVDRTGRPDKVEGPG